MAHASESRLDWYPRIKTVIARWLGGMRASEDGNALTDPRVEQSSAEQVQSEATDVAIKDGSNPQIRHPSSDIHADIDLNDKCNLQCPTCFRGTAAQKNTSTIMPLSRFREIVNKLRTEGFRNVSLVNWTEPFLCKTLHEYVPVVKEAGLDCWLSSNLSLPPDQYLPRIITTLASGVDIMFVSVSGFTQSVYEINHRGGRLDWIRENLQGIARELAAGKIATGVWIRYLEFPYNSHEKALWQDFANRLGIGFVPVAAFGDPNDPLPSAAGFQQYVRDRMERVDIPAGNDLAETILDYGRSIQTGAHANSDDSLAFTDAPDANDQTKNKSLTETSLPDKICGLIADRVAIDAKGDAYLCCAYPNTEELRIGSYLDTSESELLLRRYTHPFCASCPVPSRDATKDDHDRLTRAWQERLASTQPH